MLGVIQFRDFPGPLSKAAIWPRNWGVRGEAQQSGITSAVPFLWPSGGLGSLAATWPRRMVSNMDSEVAPLCCECLFFQGCLCFFVNLT